MSNGLGQRLRERREEIGMTQQLLAEHAKLTQSSISMYEQGEAMPSIAALKRIAKALEVDAGHLLTGEK